MSDHGDDKHGSGGGGSHGGGGGHGHGGGGHGGGGGGHEEHEGAPEWLISFADNVALMMGFFVILLAMNMQKPATGGIGGQDKNPSSSPALLDAFISIREAFNRPVDINSTDPNEAELVGRLRQRQVDQQGSNSQPGPDGNKHDMQSIKDSEYSAPCGVIPFEEGSAEPGPGAKRVAEQVATTTAGHRYVLEVRGNVSAAEAHRAGDRGMKLSFDRALAAARLLEQSGLKWGQLRVVAAGDTARAVPRANSPTGHQGNQRVEIFQTQELMPENPYASEGGRRE